MLRYVLIGVPSRRCSSCIFFFSESISSPVQLFRRNRSYRIPTRSADRKQHRAAVHFEHHGLAHRLERMDGIGREVDDASLGRDELVVRNLEENAALRNIVNTGLGVWLAVANYRNRPPSGVPRSRTYRRFPSGLSSAAS